MYIQHWWEGKYILHTQGVFVPLTPKAQSDRARPTDKCYYVFPPVSRVLIFIEGVKPSGGLKHFITVSVSSCSMRNLLNPLEDTRSTITVLGCFFHTSSSSTDRWSPGINLKMCLRTLAFLLLRGRVPNREEILVSSQEGERELLLPAKLELLVRLRDR